MLVKQEQISPCEVELKIEVGLEKVRSAVEDTYAEIGKATTVPGFRRGKAPRAILQRHLDEDKVKDRVIGRLVRPAYEEALDETKLEPFAPADVRFDKIDFNEPLVFTARVPLAPHVELADYVGLEIERKLAQVTDQDVEDEIRGLVERHAEYPQVTDRPVQQGDTAVVELKDDSKPDEQPKPNVVEVGANLHDFDAGIVGMAIDEEKVIQVTYPEDHQAEDLRGKTVPLHAKILEIHAKKVPELTDEWVKATFAREQKEGEEPDPNPVDSVDRLRAEVQGALQMTAISDADAGVRAEIVDRIVEGSTANFPEVMADEAAAEAMENLEKELSKREVTFDDYLKYKKVTLEEFREQQREEASRSLKSALVFQEIVKKEGIKVEEDDVKEALRSMAEERGVPLATIEAYVERTQTMQSIRDRILRKKLLDFLVHASNIKNVGG